MGDDEIVFTVGDIDFLSASTLALMNFFVVNCRDSFHDLCELITRNRKNKKRKRAWQYDLFARFAGIDIRKCTELELECLCIPYVVFIKRLKRLTSRWSAVPYDDLIMLALLLDIDSDGYITWMDFMSFYKRLESYLTDSKTNCSPVAAHDKMYFHRLKSIQGKASRIQHTYCGVDKYNDPNADGNVSDSCTEKLATINRNARSRYCDTYMPLKVCLSEFISEFGTVYREVQWKDSLLEAAMNQNPNGGAQLPPLPAINSGGVVDIIRKIALYTDIPVLVEQSGVNVAINDPKQVSQLVHSPNGTSDTAMFLSPNVDNTQPRQHKIDQMKLTPSNTVSKALSVETPNELNESDIHSVGSDEDTLYVSTHASSVYSGISNLSDISSHYDSPVKAERKPEKGVLGRNGEKTVLSGLDEFTYSTQQEVNLLNTSGVSSNNSRTNSRTNSRSSTPTSTFRPAGSPSRTHGGKPTYGLEKVPKHSLRHMEHGLRLSNPSLSNELDNAQPGYLPKMNSSVVGVHTVGDFADSSYDYFGAPGNTSVPEVVYAEFSTPIREQQEHNQDGDLNVFDQAGVNDISQLSNGSAEGHSGHVQMDPRSENGAGHGGYMPHGQSALPRRIITPSRVNGRSTTPTSINRSHTSLASPNSINSRKIVTPLGGFKGPIPNGTSSGMRIPSSGSHRHCRTPSPPPREKSPQVHVPYVPSPTRKENATVGVEYVPTTEAQLESMSIDVLKQNILKLQSQMESIGVHVDGMTIDTDAVDNESIASNSPPTATDVYAGDAGLEDSCVDLESTDVDDANNKHISMSEADVGEGAVAPAVVAASAVMHERNPVVTPGKGIRVDVAPVTPAPVASSNGGLTPHHGAYSHTHDNHNTAELLMERKKTVSRQKEVVKEWKQQLVVTGTSMSITPIVMPKQTKDASANTAQNKYAKLTANLPVSHTPVKLSIFKSPASHKKPPKKNIYQNHTCSWVSRNVTGKYNERFASTSDLMAAKKVNALFGER